MSTIEDYTTLKRYYGEDNQYRGLSTIEDYTTLKLMELEAVIKVV